MEGSFDDGEVAVLLVSDTSDFLRGEVGFVCGEACDVGVPLGGEVLVIDGDGGYGAAEVVGVGLVEFRSDGLVARKYGGNKGVFFGFVGKVERAFNSR